MFNTDYTEDQTDQAKMERQKLLITSSVQNEIQVKSKFIDVRRGKVKND